MLEPLSFEMGSREPKPLLESSRLWCECECIGGGGRWW